MNDRRLDIAERLRDAGQDEASIIAEGLEAQVDEREDMDLTIAWLENLRDYCKDTLTKLKETN